MATTWILTANRSKATVFESDWPGKLFQQVLEFEHPEGRLHNGDIDSDRPGRAFDSFGVARHALSTEVLPTEHLAQQFALQLAQALNRGRTSHAYDKLVLIAEPKFLGMLRAALDADTADLIVQTVAKRLPELNQTDLGKYLN